MLMYFSFYNTDEIAELYFTVCIVEYVALHGISTIPVFKILKFLENKKFKAMTSKVQNRSCKRSLGLSEVSKTSACTYFVLYCFVSGHVP